MSPSDLGLDVKPVVLQGRQMIQGYGDGQFRISTIQYPGSVLVFPEITHPWVATTSDDVTVEALAPVYAASESVDILLVGCGLDFVSVPEGLRASLKETGISLEWMDTGAACRTFNVLVAEERRVAAALIAV